MVRTTRPRSVLPSSHEFAESERNPSSVTVPLGLEVERDEVRPRAGLDARLGEPEDAGRACRHPLEQRLERELPGSTRCVWSAAKDVSSPMTPNGASSNGTSFS